jgi:pimeloyl-ACP methyl ester carboxylesterase
MNTQQNLILLHGALGSQQQFDPLIEILKAHFTVYRFNLPGHGGNPIPEKFSIPLFTDALLEFMDIHQLHAVHIFGYSMGGYIALQTAKNHPGRITKIMTLGTMLKWNPEIAANEVKMLNPEIIEAKVPKFAEQLRQRHAPQDWKEIMKRITDMMIEMGNGDAMTLEDFEKINIPVLVGLGSHDQMVKQEDTMEIVKRLPRGQFQLFEGWKHPIEGVEVEELARIISGYFAQGYSAPRP